MLSANRLAEGPQAVRSKGQRLDLDTVRFADGQAIEGSRGVVGEIGDNEYDEGPLAGEQSVKW